MLEVVVAERTLLELHKVLVVQAVVALADSILLQVQLGTVYQAPQTLAVGVVVPEVLLVFLLLAEARAAPALLS
jgi:hypothetical protein